MKLTKEDKKFLINLNLSNRDYLTNCANIILSLAMSFSAIIFVGYSIYLSIIGLNYNSLTVGGVILFVLSPYWVWSTNQYTRNVKRAMKFNKQYQKYYFELFSGKK